MLMDFAPLRAEKSIFMSQFSSMTYKWSSGSQRRGPLNCGYSITNYTTCSFRSTQLHSASSWLPHFAGLWLTLQQSWWPGAVPLPWNMWWITTSVSVSSWESGWKWLLLPSDASLWHQTEPRTGGTPAVEGETSISHPNTNCSADVLHWISHTDEFLPRCHVFSTLTRPPLQQARTAAGCSRHLSLTVMKQPFNAGRQPTRVESSLFSRCGSRTVIFLIIIFIPALRPD